MFQPPRSRVRARRRFALGPLIPAPAPTCEGPSCAPRRFRCAGALETRGHSTAEGPCPAPRPLAQPCLRCARAARRPLPAAPAALLFICVARFEPGPCFTPPAHTYHWHGSSHHTRPSCPAMIAREFRCRQQQHMQRRPSPAQPLCTRKVPPIPAAGPSHAQTRPRKPSARARTSAHLPISGVLWMRLADRISCTALIRFLNPLRRMRFSRFRIRLVGQEHYQLRSAFAARAPARSERMVAYCCLACLVTPGALKTWPHRGQTDTEGSYLLLLCTLMSATQ